MLTYTTVEILPETDLATVKTWIAGNILDCDLGSDYHIVKGEDTFGNSSVFLMFVSAEDAYTFDEEFDARR